jgi:hypothetical protein
VVSVGCRLVEEKSVSDEWCQGKNHLRIKGWKIVDRRELVICGKRHLKRERKRGKSKTGSAIVYDGPLIGD